MIQKKERKSNDVLKGILQEVRDEQRIHPLFRDESLLNYIESGMQDINSVVGTHVDYEVDLQARMLLKNYVMYANNSRLAEFKEVYASEYTLLQINYY